MLQNLSKDKRKETGWRKWTRKLRHDPWNGYPNRIYKFRVGMTNTIDGKIRVPGFARFTKTAFTGIYEYPWGIAWPFNDIRNCTKQSSNGDEVVSFLCDSASQAKDAYERLHLKGNHVIIMHKLTDFRWHKWSDYIGEVFKDHLCEYFIEDCELLDIPEENRFVYYCEVFKVV